MEEVAYPFTINGSEMLAHTLRPEGEYRVILYDFKRPDKFSLEQIHTVRVLHDTIGRTVALVLAGIIGRPTGVRCHAVDQMTFAEFMESIPDVSVLIPLSMSPLKGSAVMQIDGSLAQLLVRASCGSGEANDISQPSRQLTELECVVIRDVVEKMIPALDESWRPVMDLAAAIIDVDTDPQHVRIVPPTEMIILATMEVTVGESTAFINFAIPYLTIEPIIGKFSAQYWYSSVRRGHNRALNSGAVGVPVDVELFADAEPIRLAALHGAASGEPVELPTLAAGLAAVSAGGVPVAEVAVDAGQLAEKEHLGLAVHLYRPDALTRRLSGGDDQTESTSGPLAVAVDSIDRQIKEVRLAVEEIRDDRESLLDDLTDRPVSGADLSREPELDRRYHRDVASAIAGEDPVTVGFILAGLAPEPAAAILADLEATVQPRVVRAIVSSSDGDRGLHRKLIAFIGRRITRSIETTTSGGPDVVAEILNHTPRSVEKHVMETFLSEDKPLFEEIARRMFVFEDFVLVDPAAIAKVAARVSTEELALAMKGMPLEVSDHISAALNDEEAEALGLAIDNLGRVRRRDVESAQRDMIEELRQLEQSGEVVVARPDEVIE